MAEDFVESLVGLKNLGELRNSIEQIPPEYRGRAAEILADRYETIGEKLINKAADKLRKNGVENERSDNEIQANIDYMFDLIRY